MKKIIFLLFILSMFLNGCGYHPVETTPPRMARAEFKKKLALDAKKFWKEFGLFWESLTWQEND